MKIEQIERGVFVKRYKRFFADMRLDNSNLITSHCANTGSMMGLLQEGAPTIVSHHPNRAKLKYSWQAVKINSHWVGVNTYNPNKLVQEFIIAQGLLSNFDITEIIGVETKISQQSKCDLLALDTNQRKVFIEIKNCTLLEGENLGLFPDSVTERGQKHIRELCHLVDQGHRALLIFVSQHEGIEVIKPADNIDTIYGELLREAVFEKGLEICGLKTKFDLQKNVLNLSIDDEVIVDLSY